MYKQLLSTIESQAYRLLIEGDKFITPTMENLFLIKELKSNITEYISQSPDHEAAKSQLKALVFTGALKGLDILGLNSQYLQLAEGYKLSISKNFFHFYINQKEELQQKQIKLRLCFSTNNYKEVCDFLYKKILESEIGIPFKFMQQAEPDEQASEKNWELYNKSITLYAYYHPNFPWANFIKKIEKDLLTQFKRLKESAHDKPFTDLPLKGYFWSFRNETTPEDEAKSAALMTEITMQDLWIDFYNQVNALFDTIQAEDSLKKDKNSLEEKIKLCREKCQKNRFYAEQYKSLIPLKRDLKLVDIRLSQFKQSNMNVLFKEEFKNFYTENKIVEKEYFTSIPYQANQFLLCIYDLLVQHNYCQIEGTVTSSCLDQAVKDEIDINIFKQKRKTINSLTLDNRAQAADLDTVIGKLVLKNKVNNKINPSEITAGLISNSLLAPSSALQNKCVNSLSEDFRIG